MKNTLSGDQVNASTLQVYSATATDIANVCVGTV